MCSAVVTKKHGKEKGGKLASFFENKNIMTKKEGEQNYTRYDERMKKIFLVLEKYP